MSKKEIIENLTTATGVKRADVVKVVEAMADVIGAGLRDGAEVTLPGVGKLAAVAKAERQARNPRTGETVTVPASRAVKFKVSSTLKAAIQ